MRTILIVDDSAYARRVHRGILERAGYTVLDAANGTSAIETFSVHRPALVLLDLSMGDIGGLEVLKTLKAIDPAVIVVVVSADIQRSTAQDVTDGGAHRFIHKPANPDVLVATMKELLDETPT